jgi:hypothetical protein
MSSEHPVIEAATHFVLPRADVGKGRHAMVKEAEFFKEQGGLSGRKNQEGVEWGLNWIPVVADGLDHARLLAWFIGSGTPFPESINFTPPNMRTVGELWAIQKAMGRTNAIQVEQE